MTQRILIAEDDRVQRDTVADILLKAGYAVVTAASAREALEALDADAFDLLITDLRMPEMDGLELLREARRRRPELDVVLMTAHATVKTAITAMKEGAADYLEKPFDKDELLLVVGRALDQRGLREENQRLRQLVTETTALGNIIGEGPAMQAVFDVVRRAVPLHTTVLIQ